MSEMTSRERVLTALAREIPDRVPMELSWCGLSPELMEVFRRETGSADPASYFGFDTRIVEILPTRLSTDFSRFHPELPAGIEVDEWGIAFEPGSSYHYVKMLHPMAGFGEPGQIESYPFPDLDADYRFRELAAEVERLHGDGLAVLSAEELSNTIFEQAWYLRGMENLLVDLIANPDMAAALLDRVTAMRVTQAAGYAAAGVDVLLLGDDVASQAGMMMSLELWRRWFKPRLARIIEAARGVRRGLRVFYHSDGNIMDIIPDLIEIGVNVLNPIQPECMDPAELKRAYGDRLAFWGAIGTQWTMPFGSPDDIRAEVKLRLETIGAGGGFLIAPTHVLEPEVPWENVLAFFDAVERYGRYA